MTLSNAVVMLGHSHLTAVKECLVDVVGSDDTLPAASFFIHDVWPKHVQYADSAPGGGVAFNSEMLALIEETVPAGMKRHFVTAFGGNGYVVLALAKGERNFDFVHPDYPDLPFDPDAEILPYEYFLEALKPMMMPYVWQMIAFRQALGERYICLETPPVYGDDEYVRTHLGNYVPDPENVVPAAMRYKLWRAHSHLLKFFCDANDIEFLPAPATTIDENGYLKREAYGTDATHGNAWYGGQVIRQVERRLGVNFEDYLVFS